MEETPNQQGEFTASTPEERQGMFARLLSQSEKEGGSMGPGEGTRQGEGLQPTEETINEDEMASVESMSMEELKAKLAEALGREVDENNLDKLPKDEMAIIVNNPLLFRCYEELSKAAENGRVAFSSVAVNFEGQTEIMNGQELKNRLQEGLGKEVDVNNLDKLSREDLDKIVKNPLLGAYFKALAKRGWAHADGIGASFDQRVFNELSKFDKALAAQCRGGGKGRDLLAFSDNPAFIRQAMGDALKDDIKGYGNDETQGYINLARMAVDAGMNVAYANLVWDRIGAKIDNDEKITDLEVQHFKMAGSLRITKEITTKEIDRLSSQGGLKYGRVVRAALKAKDEHLAPIFNVKAQAELEALGKVLGDEAAANILTPNDEGLTEARQEISFAQKKKAADMAKEIAKAEAEAEKRAGAAEVS